MSDEKEKRQPTLGDKLRTATKEMTREEHAAAQRADYKRALEEELAGYKQFGKTDRAKDVQAELSRLAKDAKSADSAEQVQRDAG